MSSTTMHIPRPLPVPAIALLKRKTIGALRQKRAFLFLAAFLALMSVLFCMSLPPQIDVQDTEGRTHELFEIFSGVLIGAALLLMPGLAAASLVTERSQEHFDQLRLTLISPLGVVLANIANSVIFFLLLVVGAAPVLSVALFAIGVDYRQVTVAMVTGALIASVGAIMGTLAGALFRKAIAAILAAYVFAGASLGILPLMPEVLPINDALIAGSVMVVCANVAAIAISVILLRRLPAPRRIVQTELIDDLHVLENRRKKFPYYLIDPLRRDDPIADHANPLLVREIRTGLTTRIGGAIRIAYLSLIIAGAAVIVGAFAGQLKVPMEYLCILIPISLWITVSAISAAMFSRERDRDTVDMLRMTQIRARQVITARLAAVLLAIAPFLPGPLFIMTVAPISGVEFKFAAYALVVGIVCSILQTACVTLYISMSTQKTGATFIVSVITSALLFAWPLIVEIVYDLADVPYPEMLRVFSPVVSYPSAMGRGGEASFFVSIPLSLFISGLLIAFSIARYRLLFGKED